MAASDWKHAKRKSPARGGRLEAIGIRLFLLLFLLGARQTRAGEPEDGLHFGFLFDHFSLTLAEGERDEAVGPLFYNERKETQRMWAIPPLLSYTHDPATESTEWDFAYPLLTYDRYGDQYRWQLGQLLSWAGGPSQNEQDRHRFTLFPVYFQQRSSVASENYTAFVPFYGHLKNRLFRDEVNFVMLPLYVESRKKDVVTENYVWPFFHKRHGDGLEGWQLWPFYGHEHKEVTYLTNGFGDVSLKAGHDRSFIMWPLHFIQHNEIGTEDLQLEQGSLPLYNFLRSPKRDMTTVLWPFFTWIDDREKQYREWQLPYPFVVIARGEGKHTTRIFPFYSRSRTGGAVPPPLKVNGPERSGGPGSTNAYIESDFYLWPLYKYNRARAEPMDRERTRIMFFLYSDTILKNTETGASRRRTDLWPFFTRSRDFDGNTRLQVLALLEPYLPVNKSIERDYSHLWSLWRSEKNPRTGAASQSLLWNLYRHDTRPNERRTSVFFGCYQFHEDTKGKVVKLFYIPITKTTSGKATKTAAAPKAK